MKAKTDAAKALLGKQHSDGSEQDDVVMPVTVKPLMVPATAYDMMQQKFDNLRDAVRNLYYSAFWTPDRPITRHYYDDAEGTRHYDQEVTIDDGKLWEDVRDAAGFPKGGAPQPKPFSGVRVEYNLSRLRLLGKLTRKVKGDPEFTSDQAEAFLLLHRAELQDRLDKTVRDFLKEKL